MGISIVLSKKCIFSMAVLAIAGCARDGSLAGSWLLPRSPHESPDRRAPESSWEPTTQRSDDAAGTRGTGAGQVVRLAFDVQRIELPTGQMRHSRKIWNHIDELRIGADRVACLARNGVRVGVASPDAVPAISAVLDAAGASAREERVAPTPGLPLSILLGTIEGDETVFSYNCSKRLVGKTFRRGGKLLTIDYAVRPELGGSIDLQLGFEVRYDPGTMTWDRHGDTIRQVAVHDRHVFENLAVLVPLREGEFLVVGAGDLADNEYLAGGRFFLGDRDGWEYETILCITPRTFRTGGARRER